jgi:putative ATPase
LSKSDLEKILKQALKEDVQLKKMALKIIETEALIELSGGDARKLLSLLELVIQSHSKNSFELTNELVFKTVQKKTILFDKNGDFHYDVVSAFIKSIRGSDPNATVYWLARMIDSGEDVKFIARRMLILASEDVGIANPTALVLANSTFQAVSSVGYPEARILLSECAIYLATSPKSNTVYKAINKASEKIKVTGNLQVPLHLRNAPTELMNELGYGKGYKYSHDFQNQFTNQEYLPDEITGTKLYEPGKNKKEDSIRDFLKLRWKNKYNY